MNQNLLVTKRDGHKERIDLDKIHRVITWAAEGLNNVSVSQVELRSQIQFYDGISICLPAWLFLTCAKKPTASLSRRRYTPMYRKWWLPVNMTKIC